MVLDFEKYTVTQNEWEFEIDGMKFSCEELTTEDELDFFNYYINLDGTHNIGKFRLVQALKLKETPFTKEWIDFIFNKFYPEMKKQDSWETMALNIRLMFLTKLESKFISKILNAVGKHYVEKEESLKK